MTCERHGGGSGSIVCRECDLETIERETRPAMATNELLRECRWFIAQVNAALMMIEGANAEAVTLLSKIDAHLSNVAPMQGGQESTTLPSNKGHVAGLASGAAPVVQVLLGGFERVTLESPDSYAEYWKATLTTELQAKLDDKEKP